MRYWSGIIRICIALCLGVVLLGAAGTKSELYVVNALSEDLSVIDTSAAQVTSIPLGARGYRIAFSPQGDTAYVTATAHPLPMNQAMTQRAGTESAYLLAVDLAQRVVKQRIPLAISPLANVHIPPQGGMAYIVTAAPPGNRNMERGQVLSIDLAHGMVTRSVNIGLNPLDSVMTPDGAKLYTADWGSRSISVVDLPSGRLHDTIPLGLNPARVLTISPDGGTVFAGFERAGNVRVEMNGNFTNNNVNVVQMTQQSQRFDDSLLWGINTNTGAITRYPVPELRKVLALAVAPDGKRLYIYGRVAAPTALATPIGTVVTPAPNAHAMNGQGTNIQQNVAQGQQTVRQMDTQQAQQFRPLLSETYALLVYDLAGQRVTAHLSGYGALSSIAVSPDGQRLYLVGTPGDPVVEASVRERSEQRLNQMSNGTPVNSKAGGATVMSKGGISRAVSNMGYNETDGNLSTSEINGLIDDLRQLRKTVTVLDAATGNKLNTFTIGSLPQGCGVVK